MVSTIDRPQGPYRADHPATIEAVTSTSRKALSTGGEPLSTAC